MIPVVLACDQRLVRSGIARLLRDDSAIRIAAAVDSARELLETIERERVGVVVLVMSLAGSGLLELVRRIDDAHTGCPVLVVNTPAEQDLAVRLLRAGAAGLVFTDSSADELGKAIRRVAGDHRYVPAELGERLVEELGDPRPDPPHARLSSRESEVLRLTVAGLSGKEIADRLGVTPQTVSTYRGRIREKLEVSGVAGMVRYALEHDLAP